MDEDELIRFQGQELEGQGDSQTTRGQMSTLVHIFSPVLECMDIRKLINYSLPDPRDTVDIFKLVSDVKVTDSIFLNCTFLVEVY